MKPYKTLFLLLVILPVLSLAQDSNQIHKTFSNKITHSFSVQYNNCLYPKANFEYLENTPEIWTPKISYQRAFLADYYLTFPSGVGLSIEYGQGYTNMQLKNEIDNESWYYNPFNMFWFPCLGYYTLGVKATYMATISNNVFLKTEMGIRIPFYCGRFSGYGWHSEPSATDTVMFLNINNFTEAHNFVPDISLGVSFLFHTKRNPRSNFILGLNTNLGFVKRCSGYYALRSPFTAAESVCNISSTSTYFGINLGYSFVGLPKSFYRRAYWQEQGFLIFDPRKPAHSLSLTYNNAFAVGGKVENKQGLAKAKTPVKITPELALKYNCTIAKGFGISAELPIGLFSRRFKIDLSGSLPTDTVWSNGAIGSENFYGNELVFGNLHSGFSLRASYLTNIHRNVSMQSELGLAFTPLLHKRESYEEGFGNILAVIYPNYENSYDIPFAVLTPKVINQNNWLPNLSGAVNFLVHGKNPCHNFVFGLNFNVDFSKRMTIDYQTVPTFPDKYKSSGQVVFNMTTIGLHVGYQFMTGRRQGIGNRE